MTAFVMDPMLYLCHIMANMRSSTTSPHKLTRGGERDGIWLALDFALHLSPLNHWNGLQEEPLTPAYQLNYQLPTRLAADVYCTTSEI